VTGPAKTISLPPERVVARPTRKGVKMSLAVYLYADGSAYVFDTEQEEQGRQFRDPLKLIAWLAEAISHAQPRR
jgi:hypothetical protein